MVLPPPGKMRLGARRGRMRSQAALGCLLSAGLTLVMASASAAGPPAQTSAQAAPLLRARVDPGQTKVSIPKHFVGLSLEYVHVLGAVGTQSTGPDQMFARLLENITDGGNGSPSFRIGGGTTDSAWWNPNGKPQPNGILFDITPAFVSGLRDFIALTHQPLILGLNLAANKPAFAVDWARAAIHGFGRSAIRAFEVGNEPDVYPLRQFGNRKARPRNWGFSDYLGEFATFARRLKSLRSWLPIAAPDSCCLRPWDVGLDKLIRRERRKLDLITYHYYIACKPSAPLTVRRVLSERAIQDGIARMKPLIDRSTQAKRGLRITEGGSNACYAAPSRFAETLWATDWFYVLAALGARGVNIHQAGVSPFQIYYTGGLGGHFEGRVAPIYYAMLLFARGAGHEARLLPYVTLGEHHRARSNARLWATIDPAGTVRVVAINKGGAGGTVAVRIPGAHRPGSLERLLARNAKARGGVTLAGQAVANPTTDGTLQGAKVVGHVHRGKGGVFRFRLPGISAAMLTVKHVPGG